ncbi:uncharacterized protein LOC120700525 [Panicum virgatum]|uniref:uncharacterized protein LOC120700525 n=1 Tax=Panicum virgatum TaxID=38727 RepID=UPI0019D5FBC8|nr:uncharacterized protein LOC120700525 [Panicum virgatum]
MAANDGEPAREGGDRAEVEEDVDDEARFFTLELSLTGHREEEKGKMEDGNNKGMTDGRELVAAAEAIHRRERVAAVEAFRRRDAASEASGMAAGPVARLRALVRKLRKPKAAAPGHPSGARAAAAALGAEGNRQFMAGAEAQSAVSPILACRGGVADGGPNDDAAASPPPHSPQAAAVLPGRKSRAGESEAGLRQACRRRLGIGRSSAAVAALAPARRDDSLLQAQEGIASAIAHCKLSLSPSRGFESEVMPFRG